MFSQVQLFKPELSLHINMWGMDLVFASFIVKLQLNQFQYNTTMVSGNVTYKSVLVIAHCFAGCGTCSNCLGLMHVLSCGVVHRKLLQVRSIFGP